jgi:hypothetical protein
LWAEVSDFVAIHLIEQKAAAIKEYKKEAFKLKRIKVVLQGKVSICGALKIQSGFGATLVLPSFLQESSLFQIYILLLIKHSTIMIMPNWQIVCICQYVCSFESLTTFVASTFLQLIFIMQFFKTYFFNSIFYSFCKYTLFAFNYKLIFIFKI